MKRIILLIILMVSTVSCVDKEEGLTDGTLTKVIFKVSATGNNHQAKITTVFLESGHFELKKTEDVSSFPYQKEYVNGVNGAANVVLNYKDQTTSHFSPYSINVEIWANNIIIEEKTFYINTSQKEVGLSSVVNLN